jgi:hypothetical protein
MVVMVVVVVVVLVLVGSVRGDDENFKCRVV